MLGIPSKSIGRDLVSVRIKGYVFSLIIRRMNLPLRRDLSALMMGEVSSRDLVEVEGYLGIVMIERGEI
jgi:hypothetical protein